MNDQFYEFNGSHMPQIRLINSAIIEPPYIHMKRQPKEFILYFIKRGEMFLLENEVSFHLSAGDFLLLDPEKTHVGYKASSCDYFYVHFNHPCVNPCQMEEEQWKKEMLQLRKLALNSEPWNAFEEVDGRILMPKYFHIDSEALYLEIVQKLNEGIAHHNNRMEGYKILCGGKVLEVLITIFRYYLTTQLQKEGTVSMRRNS